MTSSLGGLSRRRRLVLFNFEKVCSLLGREKRLRLSRAGQLKKAHG
jgi:hypothetical protein